MTNLDEASEQIRRNLFSPTPYVRLPPTLRHHLETYPLLPFHELVNNPDYAHREPLAKFILDNDILKDDIWQLARESILDEKIFQLAEVSQEIIKGICNYRFENFVSLAQLLIRHYNNLQGFLATLHIIEGMKIEWSPPSHEFYYELRLVPPDHPHRLPREIRDSMFEYSNSILETLIDLSDLRNLHKIDENLIAGARDDCLHLYRLHLQAPRFPPNED